MAYFLLLFIIFIFLTRSLTQQIFFNAAEGQFIIFFLLWSCFGVIRLFFLIGNNQFLIVAKLKDLTDVHFYFSSSKRETGGITGVGISMAFVI